MRDALKKVSVSRADGASAVPARARLAMAGVLAGLLAGCSNVAVKDSLQLSGPRIAVLQTTNERGEPGDIAIQVGQAAPIPLPGHNSARIEAAWVVGDHRLALITGSGKECPRQETLLVAQGTAAQLRPLGRCLERFMFTLAGEQWTARLISSRPPNPRDPPNWVFQNGSLSGGPPQLPGPRRGRTTQPDRPGETDRAPDAERGTDTGTDAAHPAMPADPAQTPPISRPVGDDVVPPPVGGGPLPGRQAPSPRLF